MFVHHSPEIFHDPLVFLPERWLAADADTLEPWLVAFSKGPRSCLGIKCVSFIFSFRLFVRYPTLYADLMSYRDCSLGYCELFLLFAHLFRRFELSLVDVR